MICKKCKKEISDGANFCEFCGTPTKATLPNSDEIFKIYFKDASQANLWLKEHPEIKMTKYNASTEKSIGLLANSATYSDISIAYIKRSKPSNYIYQFLEVRKTNVMRSGKGKHIDVLKKLNPNKSILSHKIHTSSRGSSSSLAFGFGLDYVEHEDYLILYQQRLDDVNPFNTK